MASLDCLFNHLVLPVKLPDKQDKNIEDIQKELMARLAKACKTLQDITDSGLTEAWSATFDLLRSYRRLHRGCYLDKAALKTELGGLQVGGSLILHIESQNAALIIRRVSKDESDVVIFEVFEASPSSSRVLEVQNALLWDFPGRAAQLPFKIFSNQSFQENLAGFLEKASTETLERFAAHISKAGVSVAEFRDSGDPALISQMLLPLLEGLGKSISVPRLRKRVRDDVNIHNADLPWRRLPFWLIIRVAIQRRFHLSLGDEAGRACYKALLVTLLAQFLQECAGRLNPERTLTLRAKVCARLAKLEVQKDQANVTSYTQLLELIIPVIEPIIDAATKQVEDAWNRFKQGTIRQIPRLPLHADASSWRIHLRSSGKYIRDVLSRPPPPQKTHTSRDLPPADSARERFNHFTARYQDLLQVESDISTSRSPVPLSRDSCVKRCCDLAASLSSFILAVGDAYDSDKEQMSLFILAVFEAWVHMDSCALKVCPLLGDYHPVFEPRMLDVLQLATASDMQRLNRIQHYLARRCKDCRDPSKNIFTEPVDGCFAVRYLEQSHDLKDLKECIEEASSQSREDKTEEWRATRNECREMTELIQQDTCVCSVDANGNVVVSGCTRCWRYRCRKRLQIDVHEDFLPENEAKCAAVLLELYMPSYLAEYRNTTWMIMLQFAHPSRPRDAKLPSPVMLLRKYRQLKSYMGGSQGRITLASHKKSWLDTHYRGHRVDVELSSILLPQALDFSYYDKTASAWISKFDKPLTLQHLCGIHVPRGIQTSMILSHKAHPGQDAKLLSSYEIVSNQTKCLQGMSFHEFTASLQLLSSEQRRWLIILRELGSSNVNFSTEDTMLLFSQLASQAGPMTDPINRLRDFHRVFDDEHFCRRLYEQLYRRMRSISSNWRDSPCMEMLINLSIRFIELTADERGLKLLHMARNITLGWIVSLREESSTSVHEDSAGIAARYGLWAALLCRRTFVIHIRSEEEMSPAELSVFAQASLALQESLEMDPAQLPSALKNVLVRDIKMSPGLKPKVLKSVRQSPETLSSVISKCWLGNDCDRILGFSSWKPLLSTASGWFVARLKVDGPGGPIDSTVHFNAVEGHLLVDGRPRDRLPQEVRDSDEVRQVFGNRRLFTYPSTLVGMTHYFMLPWPHSGAVHFGTRDGAVVIRIVSAQCVLEFVPQRLFTDDDGFDLPASLIENCVHWLDIGGRRLLARRQPNIWSTESDSWTIDVQRRTARRGEDWLIDPHSRLGLEIAGIFEHFADPIGLTIFQPKCGQLTVELQHLGLSFYVNDNRLLQCMELNAEIDPDQDAGTLYGFNSKILLRDVPNRRQRSMITASGQLSCGRRGMHVAVESAKDNAYFIFKIDDVLGRISCAPEPRILYFKALIHAFTSFPLPDPLTGRTGTEEALHILTSGHSQPWASLTEQHASSLQAVARLSPSRKYYPEDKKQLQTVVWDPRLSTTIQHDSFEGVAQSILSRSHELHAFVPPFESPEQETGPSHLRRRGETLRTRYERRTSHGSKAPAADTLYRARDRDARTQQAVNVYRMVKTITRREFEITITSDLQSLLEGWTFIGGFNEPENPTMMSLSSLMDGNIAESWGSIVNFCRKSSFTNVFDLIFRLCLLSFDKSANMDMISILASYGRIRQLKNLEPPEASCFIDFGSGELPSLETLQALASVGCPDFAPKHGPKKSHRVAEDRREHQIAVGKESLRLAKFFLRQWPCQELSAEGFEPEVMDMDVEAAMEKILPEWQRLEQNGLLRGYVREVQHALRLTKDRPERIAPLTWSAKPSAYFWPYQAPNIPCLSSDLMTINLATLPREWTASVELSVGTTEWTVEEDIPGATSRISSLAPCKEMTELGSILAEFATPSHALRRSYASDLQASLRAFEQASLEPRLQDLQCGKVATEASISEARKTLQQRLESVQYALAAGNCRHRWLKKGNLWPCVNLIAILEQLRSTNKHQLGSGMKNAIVALGVQVTALQSLLRISHCRLKNDHRKPLEESRNPGHRSWDPLDYPDWLLLEIDCDILIRDQQIDVARAIISPESNSNSVLQMNMGQGKTSCVLPMAAAMLADEKRLARIVVPKALLRPTVQTIQSRLGGLLGRDVLSIPFSRRTPTTSKNLGLYAELHRGVLARSGVILTSPDHVLSFKLSGLQRLVDSQQTAQLRLKDAKLQEAAEMIKFQSWLVDKCRDILDESDFTLAVKTQLIYPSGAQESVDGHPLRWVIAQDLLSLVKGHLPALSQRFPDDLYVVERADGFPMAHFLNGNAEDALCESLAEDVCRGRVSGLRLAGTSARENATKLRNSLLDGGMSNQRLEGIAQCFNEPTSAYKGLLLVRGLLQQRILLLCLKKRWNVQYGLHPQRDTLAVPFEARGVPSEQAEFGHPDVAIIFTCLSFYYAGVTLPQFRASLERILRSDDPAAQYDQWTSESSSLPVKLQQWNIINVDDQGQLEALWKHLRLGKTVCDYYMNHFVFPVHAKQFHLKLQASGWDLPLLQHDGNQREAKTTGFSGTNDNKMLLPMTITQHDLPALHSTNAEVLTYLLQDRSRQYHQATDSLGRPLTERGLLEALQGMDIRVLIDAGAYILERDNESLAQEWLSVDKTAKGAVYFGSDNRAWVKFPGAKRDIPLVATPFVDQLTDCVVYLDEAHTRGIDLKFPPDACGALTLALGQTKDHTVQAAMRLRQLGTTQSVTFFAPPEVHRSILDVCKKGRGDDIDSANVIMWLMEQTCRANEQLTDLYGAQNQDFCRRINASMANPKFLTNGAHRANYLKVLEHPERQSLEQLYGEHVTDSNARSAPSSNGVEYLSPQLREFATRLDAQRLLSAEKSHSIHHHALEEIEQEREVEFQVEEVRQVHKPVHYTAHKFPGPSRELYHFLLTGKLSSEHRYPLAFAAMADTGIGLKHKLGPTSSQLYVTNEFVRTIEIGRNIRNDDFLRTPEWILWSPSSQEALIVIPEEVDALLPILWKRGQMSKVHLITYAAPVTKAMLPLGRLPYHAIPAMPASYKIPDSITLELGIFAGRLYVDFSEYETLLEKLNVLVPSKNAPGFLLDWLMMRRRGQHILQTPMGYICQGRKLSRDHPFFVEQAVTEEAVWEKDGWGSLVEMDVECHCER